jgi:hypothetical protein
MDGKEADLCGPVKRMKITTAKIDREQPAVGRASLSLVHFCFARARFVHENLGL